MKQHLLLLIAILLMGCSTTNVTELRQKAKAEILSAEKAFEATVAKKGLAQAFYEFADSQAVLNRQGRLIKGNDSIFAYCRNAEKGFVSLTWEAEFVEVAPSCDMGYTYGTYLFTSKDTLGTLVQHKGIFHTVWKKQATGEWHYVWD